MKGRNIRGLCILLGCALHAGLEGKGQEAAFRSFVAEQVVLGDWLPSEGEYIIQYIERKGRPIIPEEVAAILGLSLETRQQLLRAGPWIALCTGQNSAIMSKRSAPSFDVRINPKPMASSQSVRLKNPGKWAMRWDGPLRHASQETRTQNRLTGYIQFRPARNVRLLLGTHKLGWGNRLIQKEAMLFSSHLSPAFAVPVHYDFAPAWGNVSSGMRTGLACSARLGGWSLSISSDGMVRQPRWAVVAWKPCQWGTVGLVGERGWMAAAPGASATASWLGSAFAFGTSKGWQWSFECAPRPAVQAFKSTWLRSIGRGWDGFGMVKLINGAIPDHEKQMPHQWDEKEVTMGMQLLLREGDLRTRFLMEIESIENAFRQTVRASAVSSSIDQHRFELHIRWQLESVHSALEPSHRRIGLRWRFEDEAYAGNIRLEWCPDRARDGLGWACIWGGEVRGYDVKLSIAQWKMEPSQVGYFVTPAFDGIRMHGMHHHGTRAAFRITRKFKSKWKFQLIGFKSNERNPTERLPGLSTLAYAQSEIQFRLMLNL